MRILIADDDPVYQALLRDLLTHWGYEVLVAADGNQAWDLLRGQQRPDLAILDWMMPGPEGFQLCQRIRQNAPLEDIYIILMTGSRQKQDMIKVLVAGADDYLIKPFEPLDLKIRLRAAQRILDLQSEVGELRRSQEHAAPGTPVR